MLFRQAIFILVQEGRAILRRLINILLQFSNKLKNKPPNFMNFLNQAIAASNQVRADTTTRYNALVEWAANNSQNLQQLTSNIAGIPQALGGVQIDSRGNIAQQPVGQDTTRKRSIFG